MGSAHYIKFFLVGSALLLSGWSANARSHLVCSANSGAPMYPQGGGQWSLKAVAETRTLLTHVELSGSEWDRSGARSGKAHRGSLTEKTYVDTRISDAKVFELEGDDRCVYDLALPKYFENQREFEAELNVSCANELDYSVALDCQQKEKR